MIPSKTMYMFSIQRIRSEVMKLRMIEQEYAMKTIKSMAAAALAVATLFGTAACGSSNGSSDTRLDEKTGKPLVKILVVKNSNTAAMKDMKWPEKIEAACDCVIEWKEVDSSAWSQQKSATLAGGNLADLSIRAFYTGDPDQYASSFEDFSKDLDKMPNVKKMFTDYPDVQKISESDDGQIYVLPTYKGDAYSTTGQHMIINKSWLDKLGLEMPTTWDELKTVLKAFVEQDPNGNGKADEIGMSFPKLETTGYTWYTPYMLLNSLGIVTNFNSSPSMQGIYVKDGKVSSFVTTDEYKQVTKFLAELMSEGLIDKNVLSQDSSTYTNTMKGDGDTANVGVGFAWTPRGGVGTALKDQYVTLPPLKADSSQSDDEVTWDSSSQIAPVVTNSMAMSAKAPNRDTLFKIIDAFYDTDMSVESWYGTDYVEKTGDKTYKIKEEKYNLTMSPSQLMASYIPADVTIEGDIDAEEQQQADEPYKPYYEHYDHVKDTMPAYVKTPTSQATTLSNLNTTLMNYVMTSTANWIQGNSNIDDEWDSYVKKLETAGLDKQIQIWQDAYDKWVK